MPASAPALLTFAVTAFKVPTFLSTNSPLAELTVTKSPVTKPEVIAACVTAVVLPSYGLLLAVMPMVSAFTLISAIVAAVVLAI